jgi:uncharacterized lipoprotein YddW (UPF0748 family)
VFLLLAIFVLIVSCKHRDHQEIRAVWFSAPSNEYTNETINYIDSLFLQYEQIHITHLFWFNNLKDPGFRESSFRLLDTLIVKAHQKGMKLHPVYSPGAENPGAHKPQIRKEWFIINIKGDTVPCLNFSNDEVKKYVLTDLSEYLKHDIDGINLDFVRFPVNLSFSYDSLTISNFEREASVSFKGSSYDCGNISWCEWVKWNADQVTQLVGEINKTMKGHNKELLLSADVFPDYEMAQVEIGQDWDKWARDKIVDMICPMLYTNNSALFRQYAEKAVCVAGHNVLVLPGIATTSVHNISTCDDLIDQAKICQISGADGMVFFRLSLKEKKYIESIKKLDSSVSNVKSK